MKARTLVLVAVLAVTLGLASSAQPQMPAITCGASVVWYAQIYDPATDTFQTQAFTETSTDAGYAKGRAEEIGAKGSYGLGVHSTYYFPAARILRVGYAAFCN